MLFQDIGEDVTITETSTFSEITLTDESDTEFSLRKVGYNNRDSTFSEITITDDLDTEFSPRKVGYNNRDLNI